MFVRILFWALLVFSGGYYEICSACLSAALMVWLIIRRKKHKINIRINDTFIAISCISAFYFLSIAWAVDSGTALWGAVKYLVLPLLMIAAMQLEDNEREKIILDIPYAGAAMALLSFGLQFIGPLNSSLMVNGRLAGFFQYPNTFSMFLLLGILICFLAPEKVGSNFSVLRHPNAQVLALTLILGIGIFLSGSRAVLAIGIIMVIVSVVYRMITRSADRRLFVLIGSVISGIAVGVLIAFLSNTGSAGHIVQGTGSTLWGRIIYAEDAIKKIIRTPFGLGYLGYYFAQGSFQSAYYTVRWVHNDFLQLLLDVGWVPAILLIIAVVKSFLSRAMPAYRKILLAALILHGLVDFDFEFISMWFLLILVMDLDTTFLSEKKNVNLRMGPVPLLILAGVVSAGSIYVGTAAMLAGFGDAKYAEKIYPNTISETELLAEASSAEEMTYYSDLIINRNVYVPIAWDARAEVAFSQGDFAAVIEAKHTSIPLNPYNANTYTDYSKKLQAGIGLFYAQGDTRSAGVLEQEEKWLEAYKNEALDRRNPLAERLDAG